MNETLQSTHNSSKMLLLPEHKQSFGFSLSSSHLDFNFCVQSIPFPDSEFLSYPFHTTKILSIILIMASSMF